MGNSLWVFAQELWVIIQISFYFLLGLWKQKNLHYCRFFSRRNGNIFIMNLCRNANIFIMNLCLQEKMSVVAFWIRFSQFPQTNAPQHFLSPQRLLTQLWQTPKVLQWLIKAPDPIGVIWVESKVYNRFILSPGVIFSEANPCIWSHLSVTTMHNIRNTYWWMCWTVTKIISTIFQVTKIQVTFWKLHMNLLLSNGLQPFQLWTLHSFQVREGKKLSLDNDYTSASHRSPKRKICHFTSTFTVAILTMCPYATSSKHWICAYLHQMYEQERYSFTATSLRTVFCFC